MTHEIDYDHDCECCGEPCNCGGSVFLDCYGCAECRDVVEDQAEEEPEA